MSSKIIELAKHSTSTRLVSVESIVAGLEDRKDALQKLFAIGVLKGDSDRPRLVVWEGGMSDVEAIALLEVVKACLVEGLGYTKDRSKA